MLAELRIALHQPVDVAVGKLFADLFELFIRRDAHAAERFVHFAICDLRHQAVDTGPSVRRSQR